MLSYRYLKTLAPVNAIIKFQRSKNANMVFYDPSVGAYGRGR